MMLVQDFVGEHPEAIPKACIFRAWQEPIYKCLWADRPIDEKGNYPEISPISKGGGDPEP